MEAARILLWDEVDETPEYGRLIHLANSRAARAAGGRSLDIPSRLPDMGGIIPGTRAISAKEHTTRRLLVSCSIHLKGDHRKLLES